MTKKKKKKEEKKEKEKEKEKEKRKKEKEKKEKKKKEKEKKKKCLKSNILSPPLLHVQLPVFFQPATASIYLIDIESENHTREPSLLLKKKRTERNGRLQETNGKDNYHRKYLSFNYIIYDIYCMITGDLNY